MIRRAVKVRFLKLNPKIQVQNPGNAAGIYIGRSDIPFMGMLSVRHQDESSRLYAGDCDYPLVYRTVRELCGGYRGRTGKSSG